MTTAKAIDTVYRGCYFRSRLEARYALLFDLLKIAWRYEPEGYELGPHDLHYLPDFHLPAFGTWVEVKGDEADLTAKASLYGAAVNPDSGVPGMADSVFTSTRGLLILGPIPDVQPNSRRPLHSLIQHGDLHLDGTRAIYRSFAAFTADGRLVVTGVDPANGVADGLPRTADVPFTATLRAKGPFGPNPVAAAYTAARAARFDRGTKEFAASIKAALDQFKDDADESIALPDTDEVWERSADGVVELPVPKPNHALIAARRRAHVEASRRDHAATERTRP